MALTSIQFAPGIDKQDTAVGAIGRWVDSDNARFRYGLPEKVGGWSSLLTDTICGVARKQHSFVDLDGNRYVGIGTDTVGASLPKGYETITDSNTPYTTVAGAHIFANTSSNPITVNLPASPSVGDEVTIIDTRGSWASNNLTVGRNGLKINTGTADLTLSNNGQSITLVYVDATRGWAYKTNYTS